MQNPREFWRNPTRAHTYDHERFGNLKGWVYQLLEENVIHRVFQGLGVEMVLDVACGTGRITRLLHESGFAVVGCDISFEMISIAQNRYRKLGKMGWFLQCDATKLPFKDGSFDAITCVGLLMHMPSDSRVSVLSELARVSRSIIIVQYGYLGLFGRAMASLTRRQVGNVLHSATLLEMETDFSKAKLRELLRIRVLPPFSSSMIVKLSKYTYEAYHYT